MSKKDKYQHILGLGIIIILISEFIETIAIPLVLGGIISIYGVIGLLIIDFFSKNEN